MTSVNFIWVRDAEYRIAPVDHRFHVAHNPVHLGQVLRRVDSLSHRGEHVCLAEDWRPNPLPQILLRSGQIHD